MSTATKSTGAAETVIAAVTTLLEKQNDSYNERLTILHQELLVEIKELKNMIQAVQKIGSSAKKATKATTTESADAAPSTTGAPAASTAAKPTFVNNNMLWFKQQYASREDFRSKYVSAAMRTTLDEDKSIKGTGDARIKAESAKAWNLLKELNTNHKGTDKSLMAQYMEEFENAKKASASTPSPAQQNVEAPTP